MLVALFEDNYEDKIYMTVVKRLVLSSLFLSACFHPTDSHRPEDIFLSFSQINHYYMFRFYRSQMVRSGQINSAGVGLNVGFLDSVTRPYVNAFHSFTKQPEDSKKKEN